jgi:hypothetical protein
LDFPQASSAGDYNLGGCTDYVNKPRVVLSEVYEIARSRKRAYDVNVKCVEFKGSDSVLLRCESLEPGELKKVDVTIRELVCCGVCCRCGWQEV